jgi:glycosyltransferase involved in cell wall biosynthesis
MASLLSQEIHDSSELEIIISDGMSDDGTRERLERYCQLYPQVQVLNNPHKIVSTGLNLAIGQARGEIIVRMDVHTEYAPDYIAQCLAALEKTKSANVGGPARTRGEGYFQQANCLTYHVPFSCGGARFHEPDYEGPTDTVPFGCWRKSTLEAVGLFDEELVRNQDDELNFRIIESGGTIWQTPLIRSWYKPRSTLCGLFRQYAEYGYWKVYVICKHKRPASLRHLVPAVFIATLLILGGLAPFSYSAALLLLSLAGSYLLGNIAASLTACCRSSGWRFLPILPFIFATYHFAYGFGFLKGILGVTISSFARSKVKSGTRAPALPGDARLVDKQDGRAV